MSKEPSDSTTGRNENAPSGKLVVVSEAGRAEQLSHQLNQKIAAIESQFKQFSDISSESHQSLITSMQGLESTNLSLTAEIQQLCEQLDANYASASKAETQLNQRIDGVVEQLQQQTEQADEALLNQQIKTDALQEGMQYFHHEVKGTAQWVAEQFAEVTENARNQQQAIASQYDSQQRFAERQEQLKAAHIAQSKALSQFSEAAELQFSQKQQQLDGIQLTLKAHSSDLSSLTEALQVAEGQAKLLSGQLTEFKAQHNEQQTRTEKQLKKLAIASASAIAVLTFGTLLLHYFPITPPQITQDQFDDLNNQLAVQVASLSQIEEQAIYLEARQDQVESEFSTDLAALSLEVDTLQQTTAAHQAALLQVNQATRAIADLQVAVDDIEFLFKSASTGNRPAIAQGMQLLGPDWINAQAPDSYCIQILGVHRKSNLSRFVEQNLGLLSQQQLSYNVGKRLGKAWHRLYYGNYASLSEAMAALEKLPPQLQVNTPWLRRLSVIQSRTRE